MSGGRWGYLRHEMEAGAAQSAFLLNQLGQIEHALDWGDSGDWLVEEGEQAALKMLRHMFDHFHAPGPVMDAYSARDEPDEREVDSLRRQVGWLATERDQARAEVERLQARAWRGQG